MVEIVVPTANTVNASLEKNQKSTRVLPTEHILRRPKAAGSGGPSFAAANSTA
jgi:hypothetical protein